MQTQCSIAVQDVWGPRVHGCANDFDFTLLFEESILSIAPACIATLFAICRIAWLVRKPALTASHHLAWIKTAVYSVLLLIETASLVAKCILARSRTRATIAAACIAIVSCLAITVASRLEHHRTIRAPTWLCIYLAFTVPAGVVRARTLFSIPSNTAISAVFVVSVSSKALAFALETLSKQQLPGLRPCSADEKANIFSRAFVWWILPLLRKGYGKTLAVDDLPQIEYALLSPPSGPAPSLTQAAIRPGKQHEKPARNQPLIPWSIILGRARMLLEAIPARLLYTGFTFAQPFLVQRASVFMTEPLGPNTYKIGGGLIAAYFIVYTGLGTSQAFYRSCNARSITAIRTDLISAIHAHTLSLSTSSESKATAVTLMSADVERFASGTRNMHECWAGTLDIAISLWLLESALSTAAAATGGLSAIFVLITFIVIVPAGKQQNKWLEQTTKRTTAVMQGLKAMRGLKMTGAVPYLRQILLSLRRGEAIQFKRFRLLLLVIAWSAWIPTIMGPILGFTVYNLTIGGDPQHILDPPLVFRALTLFFIFCNAVAILIESLLNLFTACASLHRIQTFLSGDNVRCDDRKRMAQLKEPFQALVPTNTRPEGLDSSSTSALSKPLRPLVPQEDHGNDWASVSEGQGVELDYFPDFKSAAPAVRLQHASVVSNLNNTSIIRDASLDISGPQIVVVNGPTGCGKSTFLRMLLGEAQCTSGSVTVSSVEIGHCSQVPWLTNESVRSNIVGPASFDLDWYNTVLEATALRYDIGTMLHGDSTSCGNEGSNLSGGQRKRVALARAVYSKCSLLVLDDPINGLDGNTEEAVLEALFGDESLLRDQKTLVIWATSSIQQIRYADQVFTISSDGTFSRGDTTTQTQNGHDRAQRGDMVKSSQRGPDARDENLRMHADHIQEPTPGIDDLTIYKYYIGTAGLGWILLFFAMSAVFACGMVLSQVWVTRWAQANVRGLGNDDLYVGVYFTIGLVQLLGWTGACYFFIATIAEKSANRFHCDMLDTLSGAPMSFFSSTPDGTIINRFNQDLLMIDVELPIALVGAVNALLPAIGQIGVMIYGSPWSGLAVPIVGGCVYVLQRAYLRTSRQLRILQIEAKAPLFSNFIETLSGLSTIRALGWQTRYVGRNREAAQKSQRPFFLLFALQNWLNLVLDLITSGLAVTIMSIGVATRADRNVTIGLSLFSASNFSSQVKNVIELWTQLEITMGAVARVRQFTQDTPSERSGGHSKGEPWHGDGRVEFSKVSARYSPSLPLALRSVSFRLGPGRRFAICGRTGGGKSTLLGTLLRLINPETGTIYIDGVDSSTIDPDEVRRRFITLPQESVLVTGTVRQNLQLYALQDDSALTAALKDFQLLDVIESKGGLDATLTEDLLTYGQRQLFCFARATLQPGNIVILDEPSSQFDETTEAMIEQCIRDKFGHHTMLCIAHSLSLVLTCDTVLVMEAGAIVESGDPRELLRQGRSAFSALMSGKKT